MKRFTLLLTALLTISTMLFAVPADPRPFVVEQPDGSMLTVQLVGDEHFHYATTTDGYMVAQDADKTYHYATLNSRGERILHGVAHDKQMRTAEEVSMLSQLSKAAVMPEVNRRMMSARRIAQQTNAGTSTPRLGENTNLMIMVDFPDFPMRKTKEEISDMMNKEGYSDSGATGSFRDYYKASSNGLYIPNTVVVGPYRLQHEMAYYGAHTSDGGHDKNARAMVAEAVNMALEDGVDFTPYDNDKDGIIDIVLVCYAGYPESSGAPEETIWPHHSSLGNNYDVRVTNNLKVNEYLVSSELNGTSGSTTARIGTFCHEYGHALGLPDLYNVHADPDHYTIGTWSLMCSGCYNNNSNTPISYSSYERFFMGWLKPEQLEERGSYILEPLETENKAYLVAAQTHNLEGREPSPQEFFMIENRQSLGWDAPNGALPGHGMLVWHIDYNSGVWAANTVNDGPDMIRCHLEEANGVTWKSRSSREAGSAADTYPGTTGNTAFSPSLHNGTSLEKPLFSIAENGNTISFIFIGAGSEELSFDKELSTFHSTMNNKRSVSWVPQQTTLIGAHLKPDTEIKLTTSGNFYISTAETAPARGNSAWRQTLTMTVGADSIINQPIFVCFTPQQMSCSEVSSTLVASTQKSNVAMTLYGSAERATLITTPKINAVENLTPYSFKISWEPVSDASYYYLTLYEMKEGHSSFVQSFENFGDLSNIIAEEWYANFVSVTTRTKSDQKQAVWFKNTGDTIMSEKYVLPITNLSFWYNAMSTEDSVGVLKVEGYNGKQWKTLPEGNIAVLGTSQKRTYSQELDEKDGYIRFRLSYTHKNGSGVAVDALTAGCDMDVKYIYKGKEKMIEAVSGEGFISSDYTVYTFSNLTPSTAYYVQVKSSDGDKGCTEHISEGSKVKEVVTPYGVGADSKNLTLVYDETAKEYYVYLDNPQRGESLQIFDANGQKIEQVKIYQDMYIVTIPQERLVPHCLYMVKYISNDKMKRADKWAKFIAY